MTEGAMSLPSRTVAPHFLLGVMDDEAVDEENDDEDDVLLTLSGSRKCQPLPGAPKMLWENTATYGAIGPLWFDKGEEHIAQRAKGIE
jgi:hypothetical protein